MSNRLSGCTKTNQYICLIDLFHDSDVITSFFKHVSPSEHQKETEKLLTQFLRDSNNGPMEKSVVQVFMKKYKILYETEIIAKKVHCGGPVIFCLLCFSFRCSLHSMILNKNCNALAKIEFFSLFLDQKQTLSKLHQFWNCIWLKKDNMWNLTESYES